MDLVVQDKFSYLFSDVQDFYKSSAQITAIVGEADFLKNQLLTSQIKVFLITDQYFLDSDLILKLNPVCIFHINNIDKNKEFFLKIVRSEVLKSEQSTLIAKIKQDAENKRFELERLNSFLKDKSDEKKAVLGEFHSEELNRKNKEKKLISFLDYLNSEHQKSDFVLDILRAFWADFKKMGVFYRIGFVMQNQSFQSYVVEFDGKIDRTRNVQSSDALGETFLMQFLADLYKRPVGRLQMFTAFRADSRFIFYLENQGHEFDSIELDRYMSDRISLLSTVVQRWHLETTKLQILKQWQQLFQSYQNPVHVIDEDFNLIQSNFEAERPQKLNKCYAILGNRAEPCTECPLKKEARLNSNHSVRLCDTDYHVVVSEFKIEQKNYFFMIYESATEVNLLKSNLIQAEKMATIGQLSNHLAHELNNPLTGLKLYAEMLLTDHQLQNVTFENDMREVLKAISRSQTILNDLNQFANENQTQLVQVDFSEIVKKTMTLLKSVLRTHRIFIDLKPTFILAQPTYLQQILFNLIKNACQSMVDKGTLKIYQIDQNDRIDFIVEDDGPGLPKQITDQVFKPFFTTKEAGRGTGLGLFISHKLMSRMNGELIYNSNYTKGAQFILRFKK